MNALKERVNLTFSYIYPKYTHQENWWKKRTNFLAGVRGAVLVQRDGRQGLRARQGQQLGAQLHQSDQRQLHRPRQRNRHTHRRRRGTLRGKPVAEVSFRHSVNWFVGCETRYSRSLGTSLAAEPL